MIVVQCSFQDFNRVEHAINHQLIPQNEFDYLLAACISHITSKNSQNARKFPGYLTVPLILNFKNILVNFKIMLVNFEILKLI